MKKNTIVWITPDCFIDCDVSYIPKLSEIFQIHWIVIRPICHRFTLNEIKTSIKNYDDITLTIIESKCRERNPLKIFEYNKINTIISKVNPNLIYINISPTSPWQIPMFIRLPINKTIIAAHQGKVHEGMGHYWYYNMLRDFVFKRFKYINMFSKSQASFFRERYPNPRIFQFVLGLKYFGEPSMDIKAHDTINFLSFGIVNYAKHIDLLIDAACNIYEKGYKNIRVKIVGSCANWNEVYKPHIRYPEIFDVDIRMIDNEEIPNLFAESDYFVQPYRVLSQSGPFKIAMKYNIPLITSDLPGFTDEMVENTTGFIFESEKVENLESIMIKAIQIKIKGEYSELKARMKEYVDKVYSEHSLLNQYAEMFNTIISNEINS